MIKYKDKTENERKKLPTLSIEKLKKTSRKSEELFLKTTSKMTRNSGYLEVKYNVKSHIIANYDIILSEATRRYVIYF